MSRVTKRLGSKNRQARKDAVVKYYRNFRSGNNRFNNK